ncbi:putative inorganic phosphate transporter 1-10 [Tasmannia lanceolata]|uniref:putative inorganic phosphate transporter 1-10 n=1 Tax=Tasmannia lanceolata TaxID=3420 RepID=UPI004064A891
MALKVLSALDSAKTQYYHFKAIVIAGMGLFTDAYDLFCILPVMKLIGRLYYEGTDGKPGVTPPSVVSATVAIALLGTVIGQLVFGWLGDRIGRRRVYGISLMLMVCSSIGCGFSICRTRKCVLTSLSFFRFLLGVGIGGDYPLSATIMSEFANKRTRGSFVAGVFSMQGFGILAGSAVTMIFSKAFEYGSRLPSGYTNAKDLVSSGSPLGSMRIPAEADLVWRLILMFGALPAVLTYYWRMMMPETARYTALVEHNIRQAVKDMDMVMDKVFDVSLDKIEEETEVVPDSPSYGLFSKQFFRHHGQNLFACATAWFLVDIVFYSSTLFQSQIYKAKLPCSEHMNIYQEAFKVAKLQAIIAICSTIPGYWATIYFIDRIGRVKIQFMGFFFMSICLFAIGIPYDTYWDKHANPFFFLLYGLTFFFSNFGPNATTFIVPAELFPARFRSSCHGISGAAGKVGAIIGSIGFLWASQCRKSHNKQVEIDACHIDKGCHIDNGYHPGIGMSTSLIILGVICVLGMVITYFFTPETKGRSLEENEKENEISEVVFRRSTTNASELGHGPTIYPAEARKL